MLQPQQNKKIQTIVLFIIVCLSLFYFFPPLIFIVGYFFYKGSLSVEKILKYIGVDLNLNNSISFKNRSKYKAHYKKTAYDIAYEKRKKQNLVKQYDKQLEQKLKGVNIQRKAKQVKKINYNKVSDNSQSANNYFASKINKKTKNYEYNSGKSIWDDYVSVLDMMDNK